MMNRRTLFLGLSLVLLATVAVAKCQTEDSRYFTIGLSTTAGNHIYVERVVFDDAWWAAGGDLSGDWQQAGSFTGIHDRDMPRKARVRWRLEDTGVTYEANVRLAEDLERQARNLPEYSRISDGRKFKDGIYLIIGMRPKGGVIVWLSNAPSENNRLGRVLHVVGEAQAVEVPAVSTE